VRSTTHAVWLFVPLMEHAVGTGQLQARVTPPFAEQAACKATGLVVAIDAH